jgi:hypothetical protein
VPFSPPFPATWNLIAAFIVIEAAFALVWGVCWLLLGARFLREGRGAVVRPAPVVGLSA